MNIAKIIDQHRLASNAFGTRDGRSGRWATCLCGHVSESFYDEQIVPIDKENNPERDVQRKHAAHVAEVLKEWEEREECLNRAAKLTNPSSAHGVAFRAVERSTATKYQIQAFEREYPELVVKDLLERAAHEIGKHDNIPSQIKIDRAPAGQGEKITITWFA